MECDVCFYTFSQEDDFFELSCCKNNRVCQSCIQLLLIPQCPFCRASLSLPCTADRKLSISYTSRDTLYGNDSDYYINPYDEYYTDSRALRRQMKRIRKLREREAHDRRNRYLHLINTTNSLSSFDTPSSHHNHQRNEVQQHIREELQQYHLHNEENNDPIFPLDDD